MEEKLSFSWRKDLASTTCRELFRGGSAPQRGDSACLSTSAFEGAFDIRSDAAGTIDRAGRFDLRLRVSALPTKAQTQAPSGDGTMSGTH